MTSSSILQLHIQASSHGRGAANLVTVPSPVLKLHEHGRRLSPWPCHLTLTLTIPLCANCKLSQSRFSCSRGWQGTVQPPAGCTRRHAMQLLHTRADEVRARLGKATGSNRCNQTTAFPPSAPGLAQTKTAVVYVSSVASGPCLIGRESGSTAGLFHALTYLFHSSVCSRSPRDGHAGLPFDIRFIHTYIALRTNHRRYHSPPCKRTEGLLP